jgi:tRNA1Val (adenine37-N6)-methyltransferase
MRAASEGKVTRDALFGGRLTLFQPAHGTGYRTNVDAVLLAAFASQGRRARVAIDLGSGVGAVGLALLLRDAAERVAFVERDGFLADVCRRNVEANGWQTRADVRAADLELPIEKTLPDLVRSAALVVANPPYVAPARDGRRPGSVAGRMASRRGELGPFVRAAAVVLGQRGRACFVYPAHALVELVLLAREAGLEAKRLRFVHGRAERPARVALVELVRGKPGGLVTLPPLVEVGANGKATPDLAEILGRS